MHATNCFVNPHKHNGQGPSLACKNHDICMHTCVGNCTCRGKCDDDLYKSTQRSESLCSLPKPKFPFGIRPRQFFAYCECMVVKYLLHHTGNLRWNDCEACER